MKNEEKNIKLALIDVTAVTGSNKALAGAIEVASKKEGAKKIDFTIFELMQNEHEVGYQEKTLNQLFKLLDDKDFIGISAIGYNYAEKIVPLINALKKNYGDSKPIILGGDQAILNPDICWGNGIDALCFGEGEIDFPVLLQNWENRFDPKIRKTIKNFVLSDGDLDKLVEMRKLIVQLEEQGIPYNKVPDLLPEEYQEFSRKFLKREELDQFPYYFGMENTYINIGGDIVPKTPENVFGFPQHQTPQDKNVLVYAFMRGCKYACDYCYYNNIRKITGQTTFRTLSPEVAIKNLEEGKKQLEKERKEIIEKGGDAGPEPFLLLMNSDMCALSEEEMEVFCKLYKEKIGYPFYCMNNPTFTTKNKMRMLAQAGMVHMDFGVQTNEDSNCRYFNRPQRDEQVRNLTKWANELKKEDGLEIVILLDFIIYNPFETREELKKTVEFVKSIEAPFDYVPHTLFLGPESPLYVRYQEQKESRRNTDSPMDLLNQDCQDEEYSNFHDSYRFYKKLRHNKEFVTNTIMEFMAGQVNEEMFGRLPRFAKDLLQFDVIQKENLMKVVGKEIKKKHNPNPDPKKYWEKFKENSEWAEKYRGEREKEIDEFLKFIAEKISKIENDALTVDLLFSDEVLEYFDEHKDLFINIALSMKDLHPQRFSNEDPELKQFAYEDEYPDTSDEVNFG